MGYSGKLGASMLDLASDKGRLISGALGLAAEKPWGQVTLADIAERAGSTLVALKAHFSGKGDIWALGAGNRFGIGLESVSQSQFWLCVFIAFSHLGVPGSV